MKQVLVECVMYAYILYLNNLFNSLILRFVYERWLSLVIQDHNSLVIVNHPLSH